jgi:secreted trypsin-like serine protease
VLIKRAPTLIATALGTIACVVALAPSASLAAGGGESFTPFIIGGQETSISQVPWQVYVEAKFEEGGYHVIAACGGSILDATHVLTAAHCVDDEGTTVQHPPADFTVVAGVSTTFGSSPTRQVTGVSHVRQHPYFTRLPETKDDVAVLTLSKALTLSPEMNAEAIPLVPIGATPAPGTPLSVSGYGLENGAENAEPNGKLYATSLTAVGSDPCRGSAGVNSAVLLCAMSSTSSTCRGDSGGALTEGSPAVQVGIVDFGLQGCPVERPDGFTNVAAPEVRDFIEGSESPPVAARPTAPPVIRSVGAGPIDFSPLSCEPGTWSGSPSFTYTFEVEDSSQRVLQSGPSNVYAPPASLIDFPLVCIVQASNAGGVSTYRSATSAPVAADTARPAGSLSGPRCHLQACSVSIAASDPYSVPLGVSSRASYTLAASCPAKKGKKRRGGRAARRSTCKRTVTLTMPLSSISAGHYRATATRLPYNRPITFTTLVTNAAGLRSAKPLVRSATLRPPSAGSKAKSKHHRH